GPALSGSASCSFHADDVAASQHFRKQYETRTNVVKAQDMPWERSADGLIKHLVHHRLNTRECCVEAYMQFLKAGERSGKHRHMWEEVIFVVEGSGYDLHWDMKFDCLDAFKWEWAEAPKKFEWKEGDYIYIPPFTTHQHFATAEARLIMMSNRMVKEMGYDWFDQVENAPGFEPGQKSGRGSAKGRSPEFSRGVGTSTWSVTAAILTFAPLSLAPPAAHAHSPAEFYKGRNVELYIGYSVGGAYDLYARVLARHLGKHIPGSPTIVPKNMEGAGSLRLANWLYNVGAKDGTVLATIGRGTAFDPLLGSKGAQFRADKFTWIGSANNEVSVCVAWKTSGVTGFEDTLSKELIVGGTGQAADTDQFPRILNGVLGTKFKIVTGYPGGNDVTLAMERGEVKGRCGWSWSSVLSTH